MKHIIAIAAVLTLVGCGTAPVKPEKHYVDRVEYVITIPPKELMTLPKKVEDINVDDADQADTAAWLLAKEKYTRDLENVLKNLAGFFVDQQKLADDKAAKENAEAEKAAKEADAKSLENIKNKKVDLNVKPEG